jgi:hypothetical protein
VNRYIASCIGGLFLVSIVGTFFITRHFIKNNQVIREAENAIEATERTNQTIVERIKWVERSNVILVRSNESLARDIRAADSILATDNLADAIRAYRKI